MIFAFGAADATATSSSRALLKLGLI